MNTARKRYEAKTKVVTFRVNHELYDELKKLKAKSGLSFADRVKLGAGIAREEIEDKIEEIRNLQGKLEQLKKAEQALLQLKQASDQGRPIHVVLTEAQTSTLDWIQATRLIKEQFPEVAVLVLDVEH